MRCRELREETQERQADFVILLGGVVFIYLVLNPGIYFVILLVNVHLFSSSPMAFTLLCSLEASVHLPCPTPMHLLYYTPW